MAITDHGCNFLYFPDVLPPADIMVAILCLAAVRTRGVFRLQLFEQRNRQEAWTPTNHTGLADADGFRIISAGHRTSRNRGRSRMDRICGVRTWRAVRRCRRIP